jgi:hypothetical protein
MNEVVELGGWRIAPHFAACANGAISRHFYAVYAGDAFGAPERGIVAVMARAHPQPQPQPQPHMQADEHLAGAREAVQLIVHSFVEGYFGARRTLSARRAASVALLSMNSWLFSQQRADSARHLAPVSLTALLFNAGGAVGVVHAGACRLYRCRAGQITPLVQNHPRGAELAPTRAVGLDDELSLDYTEEQAAPGDQMLLVSGMAVERADTLKAGFALDVAAVCGAGKSVSLMRLDILARPAPDGERAGENLAQLPIRAAPKEGDNWDGFIIGKTLYHGRYTILKTAHDSIENREVALKIPLRSMLQDQVFSAGFMREAWIGATVGGHNIARYIELPAERRSSLYLVLPLYRGETLEARLLRAPPVSLPEGVGIAMKLCESVQELAALQIIHRDLKPDNIMLLAHNEIKLLDLGLAYLPGIDLADATKPGGTLRYMAPELLNGVPASPRSEVYALGVTIYRMFSYGAYPHGQHETLPLKRQRPDLPAWLGQILRRALMPDPAARFANAGELALALHQGLVSGAADAAPPPRRFSKLQFWQAAAVALAIISVILLAAILR